MKPTEKELQKKREIKTEKRPSSGWMCLKVVKKRRKNSGERISIGK